MRPWARIIVLAIGAAAAVPAHAKTSAELANKCRAMMLEAHPTERYGADGTAALQRDYFRECIKRHGKTNSGAKPPVQQR